MNINDKTREIIGKIQKTKIRLSDLLVWFIVGFSVLCVLMIFVNLIIFRQSFGNAVLNSGNFLFSFVVTIVLPLSMILMFVSRFARKDEILFDKQSIISWAKLVSEHIRNSDHPEKFEPVFIPLINDILDSLKPAVANYGKLHSSAKNIYNIVVEDENFQESWMGQELLHLCFLVEKYLERSERIN